MPRLNLANETRRAPEKGIRKNRGDAFFRGCKGVVNLRQVAARLKSCPDKTSPLPDTVFVSKNGSHEHAEACGFTISSFGRPSGG